MIKIIFNTILYLWDFFLHIKILKNINIPLVVTLYSDLILNYCHIKKKRLLQLTVMPLTLENTKLK